MGIAWIGAASGRAISIVVDRSFGPLNLLALCVNGGLGALMVLS